MNLWKTRRNKGKPPAKSENTEFVFLQKKLSKQIEKKKSLSKLCTDKPYAKYLNFVPTMDFMQCISFLELNIRNISGIDDSSCNWN